MHLNYHNVNDAFLDIVHRLKIGSFPTTLVHTRNGHAIQITEPVTITYQAPLQRVLLNPERDCNPFFHIYESMWMLAGRNDLAPLQYYVSDFGQFSDDGKTLNGAYGYRWRTALKRNSYKGEMLPHSVYQMEPVDQLDALIKHLQKHPNSRRAVLDMWNVEDDLLKVDTSKDVCCNLSVVFKLRDDSQVLDMAVFNRSNDLIWGTLGANAVHFSFLLEYMAIALGATVGRYHQISVDQHTYTARWQPDKWLNGYVNRTAHSPKMLSYDNDVKSPDIRLYNGDRERFDVECAKFVVNNVGNRWTETDCLRVKLLYSSSEFLTHVAQPMMDAFHYHKLRAYDSAFAVLAEVEADDWRIAGTNWIKKRRALYEGKQALTSQPPVSVERADK